MVLAHIRLARNTGSSITLRYWAVSLVRRSLAKARSRNGPVDLKQSDTSMSIKCAVYFYKY